MAKSKIFALLFTAFVVGMLVLSGPVQGFTLDLSVNKIRPEQGEIVTFTAEIEIESGEQLPVEKVVLELDGPEDVVCTFDAQGNKLDDCEYVDVSLIMEPGYGYGYDYGYGYGYGYAAGVLKFKIEVDTDDLSLGTYNSLLKVFVRGDVYTEKGRTIEIKEDRSSGGGICGKEWTCGSWGDCVNGVQYRECYRNLNYCVPEKKPEESRICLLGDGENFEEEESIILNSVNAEIIEGEEGMAISFTQNGFGDGLQFIIFMLLLNCIITTMNIIVKVQENYRFAVRRLRGKR